MRKVYEFIRDCGVFFVLTADQNIPSGRPFGAIMEHNGDLYIATSDTKVVYRQLKENGNVQILALKPGTRNWLRASGFASECSDLDTKQKMLDECPVLHKHYAGTDAKHYSIFCIKVEKYEFN
ncbi:MAG: pyridoxamine 5'-phosphate oxidase family protein [Clostridia bacterium]|nr:pyridoxamine 5'-phosphate oxidase family protein [Clostridia bacterium]